MAIWGLNAVMALAWIGVFALVMLALLATGKTKRPVKQLETDAAAHIAVFSRAGTPRQKLTALTAYKINADELARAPAVPSAGTALRRPGLAPRWKDHHRVHVS